MLRESELTQLKIRADLLENRGKRLYLCVVASALWGDAERRCRRATDHA
jgi:hypothetical protein